LTQGGGGALSNLRGHRAGSRAHYSVKVLFSHIDNYTILMNSSFIGTVKGTII